MDDSRKFCLDLTLDDLTSWCKDNGLPGFRAKQIYKWISSGVIKTDEMTNIPKNIRELLERDFIMDGMRVLEKYVSEIDGTVKLVYLLHDGNIIETVVMRYKTGLSVCISSQAGCKMGCRFCASAHAGFGKNLTAGELFGQVILSQREVGEAIKHVVVMGIGEPFDNFDNLMKFFKIIGDPEGLNLGARHITVSTCGLIPKIREFTERNLQINLAISLHSPNSELRSQIMPVEKSYPMDELLAACREYTRKTNRRITFEYTLFQEFNDSEEQAKELARQLRGMLCHVNLIACNEFPGSPYKKSSRNRVERFRDTLISCGINATVRREMGTDIMAACGQLRRGIEGNK